MLIARFLAGLTSHTLRRERKGLVTLQLPIVAKERNYRPLQLGNKMLTSP